MDGVEEIFLKSGALLKGHFQLTSGRHSPVYWEKFLVMQFPRLTEQLCGMIAGHFRDRDVQAVAGPTTGGIILAHEVGCQMGTRSLYAEKEGGARVFRRGFNIDPGERVLVVDDILTTGSSVREVMAAVTGRGGRVIGVGVLVDRSGGETDFGVPLFSCHRAGTTTYRPEECPLCREGIPLVKPGSS